MIDAVQIFMGKGKYSSKKMPRKDSRTMKIGTLWPRIFLRIYFPRSLPWNLENQPIELGQLVPVNLPDFAFTHCLPNKLVLESYIRFCARAAPRMQKPKASHDTRT